LLVLSGPSNRHPATSGVHRGFLTILASSPETPIVRILLAEDFASYRSVIASLLTKNPEFQVIGEASDGLEAVKKATELGPDLIFTDIGLPKLNGLEAARRVLEFDPSTKIVFLTQETDRDVVREALSLGASGYLLKQGAEAELLTAIAAVLQGKRFVGRGISPDGFGSKTGPERAG
jgi:two-component system, NarL family, response regulator NreC